MKLQAIIVFFICAFLTGHSFAISCPDIESIKKGDFQGWLPINNLDDEPATNHEIIEFKRTLQDFSGAEWSEDYSYGYGRCNYNSDIEVSLASSKLSVPIQPTGSHWTWDGILALCESRSISECLFGSVEASIEKGK